MSWSGRSHKADDVEMRGSTHLYIVHDSPTARTGGIFRLTLLPLVCHPISVEHGIEPSCSKYTYGGGQSCHAAGDVDVESSTLRPKYPSRKGRLVECGELEAFLLDLLIYPIPILFYGSSLFSHFELNHFTLQTSYSCSIMTTIC